MLARMVALDEAALICDFAQTYHILHYRELPARQAALLACGLPAESRIRLRLTGAKASLDTMLRAIIADQLRTLVWMKTEDGWKNRNRPPSIFAVLTGKEQRNSVGFDSPEEFDAWRASMIGGDNNA